MFYKAPDMTHKKAEDLGLVPIRANVIEIIDLNIDNTIQPLSDAWEVVKKHFINKDDCWVTIGYITKDSYDGADNTPSLWKRFIDFWWMS